MIMFEDPLIQGNYKLSVTGLNDFYGSPVTSDTLEIAINQPEIDKEFYITSFAINNNYEIELLFNLELDENSNLIEENFIFSPSNKIKSFSISNEDRTKLIIKTSNAIGSIGIEYRLELVNIYSSLETGSIKIKEGAGSTLLLTGFADNLNDLYVYPNPVRSGGNISFANLTKTANISIFNMDGKKIYSADEDDGDGSLQWDLVDERGQNIASGIYIYIVQSFDKMGRKIEEKMGKFALLK